MTSLQKMFVCIATAFLLNACGPIYHTEYTYVPPTKGMGKMCAAQCVQAKNVCEQSCALNNQTCTLRAHQDALAQFQIYKQEQLRKGKKIKRSVTSFENTSNCSKSCGCEDMYNTCYTTCGGQVIAKQVCVAFCGNQ